MESDNSASPHDASSSITDAIQPSPSDIEKALLKDSPSATASNTRRRRLLIWTSISIAIAAVIALALGLGLHFGLKNNSSLKSSNVSKPAQQAPPPNSPNQVSGPAIDSNFADPAYILIDGTYWAFATNKYVVKPPTGQVNIQIAKSTDFETWQLLDQDALPQVGAWAAGYQVWAPDVVQLDDDSFLMYYSATTANDTSKHCIGTATAKNVTGPYTAAPTPAVCPTELGGAIDPDGYKDADGTRYLIYKVDGNSLNKPNVPWHSTPIMLQQVAADGVTFQGAPIQILDRTDADGPLIEAPSMARYQDDSDPNAPPVYVLFYSSNVFTTPRYDVSYATAATVKGPFVRSNAPLLKSGDAANRLVGPGGLDCGVNSKQVVFHSIKGPSQDAGPVTRTMWTGDLNVQGGDVGTKGQ